jgi:class 3 adenylate cyclase
LNWVAEGKPIKAIAAAQRTTPEAVDAEVETLFVKLAQGVSAGTEGAIRRLRLLHQCIVDREEQGESLSRLLPGGLAEKLRRDGRDIGKTEVVEVTVLMSDIRSYSTIAEHADPSQLASQLNTHRAAMNEAILGQHGTIMQFVGDAVMAVFGAPFSQPDHAARALAAAADAHRLQAEVNARWERDGLPAFGLGLGLSTGEAAAALLGTEERLEYTLVGDTVNLSQRLQQLAEAGETVLSQATMDALEGLAEPVEATLLPEQLVKGRDTPVRAWRVARQVPEVAVMVPARAVGASGGTGGSGPPSTSGSSDRGIGSTVGSTVGSTAGTRTGVRAGGVFDNPRGGEYL